MNDKRAIDMCTCGHIRSDHSHDNACQRDCNCFKWFPQPQPISNPVKPDIVNKPPHYIGVGIEAIDVIEGFDLNFHLGNVLKYILRHKKKNGLEDLQKARWYLDREISRRQGQ